MLYSCVGENVVNTGKVKLEGQVKKAMLGRYHKDFGVRPRLLLAYADAAYASECGRYFRRLGWEVEMVASAAEARDRASAYRPNVVVLDAELLDESSWLTSVKISIESPDLRIILVGEDDANSMEDRLHTVGADRLVSRAAGAEALAMVVLGQASLSEAV
jgi:DNA-binding response OmpR family regulator